MKPLDYRSHNRQAWDELAKAGNRFARPARSEDFIEPLASVDGPGWLGSSITGMRLLCLAAGGGRQGPVYAAAGAKVTVVDISDEMLELDRQIANREKLNIRVVETSMDDLSMFADRSFDIVIQPVSSCYIPNPKIMFDQIARITEVGGTYISQHKQPASLQSSIQPGTEGYTWKHLANTEKPLPEMKTENLVREQGTLEFAHSLQMLLGEMCRSGFQIHDLIEPDHADRSAASGTFEHRSAFIAPYVRVLAKRNSNPARSASCQIWQPGD